ncbi:Disease resistance protein L6 [Linum perenne]
MDQQRWPSIWPLAALSLAVAVFFLPKKRPGISKGTSPSSSQSKSPAENPISAPSSSSKYSLPVEYEVFLSFRGPDVRTTFADVLYKFLDRFKIRTFLDDEELRKGEKIAPSLTEAIKESKVYIPILSQGYASSKWCLQELALMVKWCKQGDDRIILPIFYMMEPRNVRHQEGSYKEAFRLHSKKYDAETIKEWKEALKEVGEMKGWSVKESDKQGDIIEKVYSKVWSHLLRSYKLVTDELVGIDSHVQQVTRLLTSDSEGMKVVGIHGMGGMGKTTIAKAVYNELYSQFDRFCFVEDAREILSKSEGIVALQSKIISSILRTDYKVTDASEGLHVIKDRVCKHKVLVVLDDVNNLFEFDQILGKLDNFSRESRFIVTTRDKRVLEVLQECKFYEPGEMSNDHALQLFSKHAFGTDNPPEEDASVSMEFVKVAAGLPLALKVIGSLLFRRERKFWAAKLMELKDIPPAKLQERLKVSYNELSDNEKQIFLDIACFFIGIEKDFPFYMWSDCKFYPESGINTLLLRSLIRFNERNQLWMHDHIRDLGRAIVREEDSQRPWKRSRIWSNKDALNILKTGEGSNWVEFLSVDMKDEILELTDTEFKKLSGLRYLEVHNGILIGDFKGVLPNLRWLRLQHCRSIPSDLNMKKLVILEMERCPVEDEWRGWSGTKVASNLKAIHLHYCHETRTAPDLSQCRNLEWIDLEGCLGMSGEIHIGNLLKNLKLLRFSETNITKLTGEIGTLENLQVLDAGNHFVNRNSFSPEIMNMPTSLTQLSLSFSRVLNLSELKDLEELCFEDCDKLQYLGGLWKLSKLRKLELKYLSSCNSLLVEGELPSSLNSLYISGLEILPNFANLQERLKVSYNELSDNEKQIFLDIACFFISTEKDFPFYMWSDCKFYPESGINTLLLRSLVRLNDENEFWMHDHIRDLGRAIIHEEDSQRPWKRSRIWSNEDALDILKSGEVASNLKAIQLQFCKEIRTAPDLSQCRNLEWIYLHFCTAMRGEIHIGNLLKNLKLLRFSGTYITMITGEIGTLENLQVLDAGNLSEFPREIMNMPTSLNKLTLSSSTRVLNLSELKDLEELCFDDCDKLQYLGGLWKLSKLRKLVLKYLSSCNSLLVEGEDPSSLNSLQISGLEILPNFANLNNLTELALEEFQVPEIQGLGDLIMLETLWIDSAQNLINLDGLECLSHLNELWLKDCCVLEKLPVSLANLTKLQRLTIEKCTQLAEVMSVERLEALKLEELCLDDCDKLQYLGGLWKLSKLRLEWLEHLYMSGCSSVEELPDLSGLRNIVSLDISELKEVTWIGSLELLKELTMTNCTSIKKLPNLSGCKNIFSLYISGCVQLADVMGVGRLESLKSLVMSGCSSVEDLPDFSGLRNMASLDIKECNQLEEITGIESLELLKYLVMRNCTSIKKLPDLSGCKKLRRLDIRGCVQLAEVGGIERLESLKWLNMSGCSSVEELPDLSGLWNVNSLDISECNQLKEVTGIGSLELLEELVMRNCTSIKKLPDLSGCKELHLLDIRGCIQLAEVSGIDKLVGLKVFR